MKKDLKTGWALKTAVAEYAQSRIQDWLSGKIHAMDCGISIYNAFKDMNRVENMEIYLDRKDQKGAKNG